VSLADWRKCEQTSAVLLLAAVLKFKTLALEAAAAGGNGAQRL
jgi:hypothetical protein